MICSPCLSDLHEFCRDDVRDCDCDCQRWLFIADDIDDDFDEYDRAQVDDWQREQDRYERRVYGDD